MIRYRSSAILLSACLIIYAFVGFFMRPVGDDFCALLAARELGPLRWAVEVYTSWSGRFSLFAISGAFFSLFGSSLPAIAPFLMILGLVAVWTWALRSRIRHTYLAIAAITFATIAGMPNVFQNLYWASGSMLYFLPIILSGLLVGAVIRSWHWSVIAVLSFVLAGFNEPHALLLVGLASLAFIYWRRRSLALVVAFSLLGLVVSFAAPGNSTRGNEGVTRQSIPTIVLKSTQEVGQRVIDTSTRAPIAIIVPVIIGVVLAPTQRVRRRVRLTVGLFAMGFLISIGTILPVEYALSAISPRAYTLTQVILSVCMLVAGIIIGSGHTYWRFGLPGRVALSTVVISALISTLIWATLVIPSLIHYSRLSDAGQGSDYFALAADASRETDPAVATCVRELAVLNTTAQS